MKNKDLVSNHVFKTTDYEKFNFSERNRNVLLTKSQVDSFKKNGIISPIFVNENMTIIDGQHRFKYAKSANIPIEYIIISGLDDDSIIALNTSQKSWKSIDYIEAYANDGNQNYIDLIKLIKRFSQFNVGAISSIAMGDKQGGGHITKSIKDGEFKISDFDSTFASLSVLEDVFNREPRLKIGQRQLMALSDLKQHEVFDMERFIKKINSLNNQSLNVLNAEATSNSQTIVKKAFLDVYNSDLDAKSPKYIEYTINSKNELTIES